MQRYLTRSERKRFMHITRGLPQVRKRREIMDHMYALFDRRCRTHTALRLGLISQIEKCRNFGLIKARLERFFSYLIN